MIESCRKYFSVVCVIFLATFSAYGQRGTLGILAGETTDKFGSLSSGSAAILGVDTNVVILKGNQKEGGASVVAGGEMRFPTDTTKHTSEFAIYGGPMFQFGGRFSIGFHAQIRKLLLPTSNVNGQAFARYNMTLLELPGVLEYKFSSAPQHAFLQVQVSPEFKPRFTAPKAGTNYPTPTLDHGYSMQGTLGYVFGKWYAKATYENRYFKFSRTTGNPDGLNNWKTEAVIGGIGLAF